MVLEMNKLVCSSNLRDTTYIYRKEDGEVSISCRETPINSLVFEGLFSEEVSYTKKGKDLIVDIERGGSLTVVGYYELSDEGVEKIVFDDVTITQPEMVLVAIRPFDDITSLWRNKA